MESSGSFFVSPFSKRVFSSSITSPSFRGSGKRLRALADDVGRHLHGLTEQLRQAVCHNLQGERGVWSVLGLAHVRAENHARAVLDEIFNCRQGGNNTLVACDLAVLGGDIEVAAAKNALAGNVDVFYGFLL